MAHNLFNEPVGYDRSTLTLLGQAFDEVWQDIAGNYTTAQVIEERRMRLALIILELANIGGRDLDAIKDDALAIMRMREQQIRSMH
jgi:hypothetical protein